MADFYPALTISHNTIPSHSASPSSPRSSISLFLVPPLSVRASTNQHVGHSANCMRRNSGVRKGRLVRAQLSSLEHGNVWLSFFITMERQSLTTFDGDPWLKLIPLKLLVIIVPSFHDESARIDGALFRAN